MLCVLFRVITKQLTAEKKYFGKHVHLFKVDCLRLRFADKLKCLNITIQEIVEHSLNLLLFTLCPHSSLYNVLYI